jgi:hypothetical protein
MSTSFCIADPSSQAAKGTSPPVIGIPVPTGIPVQGSTSAVPLPVPPMGPHMQQPGQPQAQQPLQQREVNSGYMPASAAYPGGDPLLTYMIVSYTFSDLYCHSNTHLDRKWDPCVTCPAWKCDLVLSITELVYFV